MTTSCFKPGFRYRSNATTMTQKQSDYKVEQLSFTIVPTTNWSCRGHNWLNGN